MSNNLVSMENLDAIMKPITLAIKQKIDARDITAAQKTILTKADLIDVTTNNGKFLADNGTYITIDTAKINDVNSKTANVMDLFKVNYTNDAWDTSKTITLPIDIYGLTSQLYNGKIYCIGGCNGTNYYNSIYIYDIASNTWTTGANMPTNRAFICSQLYNGKIYCLGGRISSSTASNKLEIYDIANNSWTTGANMSTALYGQTSQLYNGKIYCIGGYNGSAVNNLVQIYDITNNSWTTGANMSTVLYGQTSQLYNGKIYCIGGYASTPSNLILIYNITNNSWTTGANMTTARGELTSQLYNDKIYCIGGYASVSINNIEIYNILTDTWINSALTLPSIRCDLTSQLYNGKVYCIGGYTTIAVNKVDVLTLGITNYTLTLPADLQTKLNLIPDAPGDGTKVLADNGQWIDIPLGYRFMSDTEIANEVTAINSYTG